MTYETGVFYEYQIFNQNNLDIFFVVGIIICQQILHQKFGIKKATQKNVIK